MEKESTKWQRPAAVGYNQSHDTHLVRAPFKTEEKLKTKIIAHKLTENSCPLYTVSARVSSTIQQVVCTVLTNSIRDYHRPTTAHISNDPGSQRTSVLNIFVGKYDMISVIQGRCKNWSSGNGENPGSLP